MFGVRRFEKEISECYAVCMLYCHLQHHNDTLKKRRRKTSLTKYMYLSLYCKGSKRVTQGLRVRGSRRPNRTSIFWPPLLWPSTLWLSRSPDAQPEALGSTLLGAGFLYCILSATSLVPKLHRGSRGPPRPGVAFPTTSRPSPTGSWTLSWRSYIIVQHPLDLWNRMFDRHQAEITVMLFTGHSLPVHQSMSVPWEFFTLSHFISQFLPPRFPLITAIRMCHFLPVHHLGMAFLAGSKAKIQHIVVCLYQQIPGRVTMRLSEMTFRCQIWSNHASCQKISNLA